MSMSRKPVVKLRITYGNDKSTKKYRHCYEKVKKDIEKVYHERVVVHGKKSHDRSDCFDIAVRDTNGELEVFYTKEKFGLLDSERKLHKVFAKIEERLGDMDSDDGGNTTDTDK